MDMSFTQDPRYQKAVLKLSRLPDYEHSAINTAALDAGFANQDMRKRLALMQLASTDLRQRRSLSSAERRTGFASRRTSMAERGQGFSEQMYAGQSRLGEKVRDFDKQSLDIGTAITAFNTGADMWLGHRKKMAAINQAKGIDAQRRETYGGAA